MLVRCLYASRAAEPTGDHVLDAILAQSRRNNPRRGITGMLCFANDIFMQVLEGSRSEVSALLARIVRDPRHADLQILLFEEITERRFGHWTMGQVNMATMNPAVLLKYSEKSELDPFACTGPAMLALLMELANSGSIMNRSC